MEQSANVTYIASFFTLTHTHHSERGTTDEQVVARASEFLNDYYGFDIESLSHDITVEWLD